MTQYFGVVGNRDMIKINGDKMPFWDFLDKAPDGWLTSLAYKRDDMPTSNMYIYDCGAWSYKLLELPMLGKLEITPTSAMDMYSQYAPPGSFLIAPDHMLIPGVDIDFRRRLNADNAKEFLKVIPMHYFPMATIHGMDTEERIVNAMWLYELGYRYIALGGIAARASQKRAVVETVTRIRNAIPDVWLHVLGLSSPDYMRYWNDIGIQSCDGASHFKQAFTAGTFFSFDPESGLVKHKAAKTDRGDPNSLLEPISAPLCDCKACFVLRSHNVDTRQYGSNEHNMGRAAHNLNMLLKAHEWILTQPSSSLV